MPNSVIPAKPDVEGIPGNWVNLKKRTEYRAIALALNSETLEWMVAYFDDENGPTWVRPLNLFLEKFERVEDETI